MSAESPTFDSKQLSADADQALGALSTVANRAVALVEAWVKAGNVAAVAEAADRAQGPARKAARRGLSVLKSRGLTPPRRTRVARLEAAEPDAVEEAWMLAPDSGGSVLLVLTARARASRYRAAFVFVNDAIGILRVESGEMSPAALKKSMARALPGARYKPVAVPVAWARHRIALARAKHGEGRPLPLGLTTAASLLEPPPDSAPPHPFDEEGLVVDEADARVLAQNSIELHRLAEFGGWFPPAHAVDELLIKLGENIQVAPGSEPDPDEMKRALEAEIRAATDRFFAPQVREAVIAAMKDSALSVLARDGEERALEVVATMKCIELCGLITDPPSEVGFLRGYFDKAVSYLLARGGGSLRIPVPNRAPLGEDAQPATLDTSSTVGGDGDEG